MLSLLVGVGLASCLWHSPHEFAGLAEAVQHMRTVKDARPVAAWHGVADVFARAIGRTRDLRIARRRVLGAAPSGPRGKPLDGKDDFRWRSEPGMAVRVVGGPHPGLLGHAGIMLGSVDREGTDRRYYCLFWFERGLGGWRGQAIFVGGFCEAGLLSCLDPQETLATHHYLVVTGQDEDRTNISGSGALVFRRQGSRWVFGQKVVSDAEAHDAHFGRGNRRMTICILVVKLRVYLDQISMDHVSGKRYCLDYYRFTRGRYRYYTEVPVSSALRTLDDMIYWAKTGHFSELRRRCATARQATRFASMLKCIPGKHALSQSYRFEGDRQVGDDDTSFVLAGTHTRLRFRHVGRGWILASMRKTR